MSVMGNLIEAIRYQVNRRLDLDVVRVSGQHTLRTHLIKIIEEYAVDALLDVGANEGAFGTMVRGLGFRGEIFSFEPVRGAFDRLSRLAAEDEKWTAFDFALGAEAGEALINVSKFSQFSSILPANEYGVSNWKSIEVEHQQQVKIRSLNECIDEGLIPRKRRFLLKMDTQGYDLQVFRGAGYLRDNICCMLSELSIIPIYHGMPHYLEALSEYERNGFSVSGFFPITRRKGTLTLNEVDCMLVSDTAPRCEAS